jgi:GNAT superfamily N-acetyltransferase
LIAKARRTYWRLRSLAGIRRLIFFDAVPRFHAADASPCPGRIVADAPESDLQRMAAMGAGQASAYRGRLAAGHLLVVARDAGRHPLAWGWLTPPREHPVPVPWEWDTALSISPAEGYLWDFFTTPEARGRGLYRGLLRQAVSFCSRHCSPFVRIYCYAESSPSRRGILAADFRETASLTLARGGPIHVVIGPSGVRVFRSGTPISLSDLLRPSE